MTRQLLRFAVAAVAATVVPGWAFAQAAAPAAPATAPGSPPASSIAGFQRWSPEPGGPGWREANDTMGALRGHVGHVARPGAAGQGALPAGRAGQGAASAGGTAVERPMAPATPAPTPQPGTPHGTQHMHGGAK